MPTPTAIIGANGYAGVELLRMIWDHPQLDPCCVVGGRRGGGQVSDTWVALRGHPLGKMPLEKLDVPKICAQAELVFLALPHGVSAPLVAQFLSAGLQVVDLGADFRLDAARWERSYGAPHAYPELLAQAAYGLPEISPVPRGARLIAGPGCYPTATTLAAWPLANLGAKWLVADCMSGISGAGRSAGPRNLYGTVNESVVAYGMGGVHRHTVEMERNLKGASVSFTPHLVPMTRGLLATVHAQMDLPATKVKQAFVQAYDVHPLVVLRDEPPATADVRGSALAHLHVAVDEIRGVVSVSCAIDNLLKGAGAQALQALNLANCWPETLGLPLTPVLL
ncbi:MAG: N-acetyl-gamma-glutamyl-phosphate reductase [Cognaticolwellia sp.]|jgi:N-acetyl-gamma-glutamyl-phosphate reductase